MSKASILTIVICILLGMPVVLTLQNTSGTSWEQTSESDFGDGEDFFVETSGGTLKLDMGLVGQWRGQGEASTDYYGLSVAGAGDVNGDGYADLIVGAYSYSSDTGRAYIYHGSATGVSSTAAQTLTGGGSNYQFGISVAPAGDVNDDGYDDVIIGARAYSSETGRAYVYHGSATGVDSSIDTTLTGETAGDDFGDSVASAGDVNGDGYDDVIVGAFAYSSSTGRAYLYHGSSSGVSTSADTTLTGENTGDSFATCVAGAGDVNKDGYDDVIVGASAYSGNTGRVYYYAGTSTGIQSSVTSTLDGADVSHLFGWSVASAGDVNGDSYDDIIIGAYGYSPGGRAYVYHGSSSGLSSSATSSLDGASGDDFGYSVAGAGDVNGDGYDDVIIGAKAHSMDGAAYFHQGSRSGVFTTATQVITGQASDDDLGWSVAGAGDVNGDGYDDVIIGADENDEVASNAGAAYVYSYGLGAPLSAWPQWPEQGGASNDEFGASVASAGDVNGDGYDDVIVGADGSSSDTGKAHIYHGSSSGIGSSAARTLTGEMTSDYFGYSVAGAGDVNGDGYDDVIVGAYGYDGGGTTRGRAYIYHGSSSGIGSSAARSLTGTADENYFGDSVAGAGDVNGDGYDDVIIGADGYSSSTGRAYIYHGSSSGIGSSAALTLTGEATGDSFGLTVAGVGDVDGDGYDDVMVGALGNDDGASGAGEVYVYHGSSSGLSATPDWSDQGEAANDQFGCSVAAAGDVNGDGYDDVIVGARYNDGGESDAGEVYVYHGSSSGLSASPDWSDQGEAVNDYFGSSVAAAGDVNGDGYDDIIIGAYFNDDAGYHAGEAYVYQGSSSGLSATPDWSGQGEAGNDLFSTSVASAGDTNGDGYDDVIVGADGNDDGGDNAGEAYVYHGSGYVQQGIYESSPFNVATIDGVGASDWLTLSWNPTAAQPTGTTVKALIGTSDDGNSWTWHGPTGSTSVFYTESSGQAIYSGDTSEFIKLRLILTSDFGEGGDAVGDGKWVRTPTVDDFTVEYRRFKEPSVDVLWPNGGENLMHGETYDIIWETTGDLSSTDPVALSYRLDGGSWVSITTATENDGEYRWTLPSNEDVERALVKVVATAVDGSTVSDTCDMTFSIDPPPESPGTMDRVLSPGSGDELVAGGVTGIQWQLTGEDPVSLYYSTNFGQSWNVIVEDFNADTLYNWRIPDDLTSENVLIRVKGANAELTSGIFMIGEGIDDGVESTGTEAGDSNDSSHLVTGGLTALVIGLLIAIVGVARYHPRTKKQKTDSTNKER